MRNFTFPSYQIENTGRLENMNTNDTATGENSTITKLFNYLETGITFGSHTVPALALPPQERGHRILHIHNNVPGVLSEINTRLSDNKINILQERFMMSIHQARHCFCYCRFFIEL